MTNRYESIARIISEKDIKGATFIKALDRKSAERIIKRALSQGWWFATWQSEGEHHIAFSCSIDLEKDLRRRLPDLKFEID